MLRLSPMPRRRYICGGLRKKGYVGKGGTKDPCCLVHKVTCSTLGKWNVFGDFLNGHIEDCQTTDLKLETKTYLAIAVFLSFAVSE